MERRQKLGFAGQSLVEKYLLNNNYEIIHRNIRFGHLEVDIIAFDKTSSFFVFVEVKTRSSRIDDLNLKQRQIKKLKKAMLIYSLQHRISLEKLRLDYIEVIIGVDNFKTSLKHFKDALD